MDRDGHCWECEEGTEEEVDEDQFHYRREANERLRPARIFSQDCLVAVSRTGSRFWRPGYRWSGWQ